MSLINSFIFYDVTLLVIFAIFLALFLYKNRSKVSIEGIMILYRTSLGINLMDKVGKSYKRLLGFLGYVSIVVGYVLMVSIMFLVGMVVYTYIRFPQVSNIVKAPPVVPIFPYFTNVFGLESFFPTFYGIYFIVIIAITMFVHEFAHGIFMRLHGIKIKSTGLAFLLLIVPGAFVEQDEKSMTSKKKVAQMSVLSAGVFANVIVAIIAYILLISFFTGFFVPSGAVFNTYPNVLINSSEIQSINGIPVENLGNQGIIDLIEDENIVDNKIGEFNLTEIKYQNEDFLVPVENLKVSLEENGLTQVYFDNPSIRSGFPQLNIFDKAAITKINNVPIKNYEELSKELQKYSPKDVVNVSVEVRGENKDYSVILGENPSNKNLPFLGISVFETQRGITGWINFYKDEKTLYKPINDNEIYVLIHDFFWWLALINLLVAMFNMLPVGILDGGRFFYLTILGVTKSEKVANIFFKTLTYLILLSIILVFAVWIFF